MPSLTFLDFGYLTRVALTFALVQNFHYSLFTKIIFGRLFIGLYFEKQGEFNAFILFCIEHNINISLV